MSTPSDTPRSRGDSDAPHLSPATPAEDARTVMLNRISWGAVLAGVVVALVTQLILNMIGVGIGAATLDPATGDNPEAGTFSIGAAIWWTVSGILAAFAGGYAAGRLAGKPKESTAGWHGLTAWALTTLVVFYLLTTTVGSLIGGVFSTISSAAGGLGRTAATAAEAAAPALAQANDPFSAIEQSVREATGGSDPAAMRDAAVAAVRAAGPATRNRPSRRASALPRRSRDLRTSRSRRPGHRFNNMSSNIVRRSSKPSSKRPKLRMWLQTRFPRARCSAPSR
jgi:hypothetical protein